MPGYFNNYRLGRIFAEHSIKTRTDFISFVNSTQFIFEHGIEESRQYDFLIKASNWSDFPHEYSTKYENNDLLINELNGVAIRGNFHNHTTFSDGTLELKTLIYKAVKHNREFIGISDHSKRVGGVDESMLNTQIQLIDEFQPHFPIKILKSIECEILDNGDLDLQNESLQKLDYVIIGLHSNANQPRKLMENRIVKAIENPYSNILAHPSARIYKKKPPINIDMYKILDACVQNNVVIEINGDPSRLDLDPKYINYALDKGAYFSLDSDTHSQNGFYNINNAILIARDYNIPPERCINTLPIAALDKIFREIK